MDDVRARINTSPLHVAFFRFNAVHVLSFFLQSSPSSLLTISSLGLGRLTVSAAYSVLGRGNQGLHFGSPT